MAERRMFAKQIIDSDAFLDMPASTQALYFHLGMRGDDEGFINNPKKIARMINASEDDMKILVSKKFIIPFESGVCVIKHWKIHNYIRGDRLSETVYEKEKSQLSIKNNNVYSMSDVRQSDVSQLSDKSQHRLVEVRLVEDSIGKDSIDASFHDFWSSYPKKVGKDAALKAWNKKKPNATLVIDALTWQTQSEQWKRGFIPNPATYINEGRWQDEPVKEELPF